MRSIESFICNFKCMVKLLVIIYYVLIIGKDINDL